MRNMKVTLFAGISANGQVLLAGNPNHAEPEEAFTSFIEEVIRAGSLIMGRTTLEVMNQFPGGIKTMFPGAEIVILSNSVSTIEGCVVADSPEKAIAYLEGKGFEEVVVGGGSQVYNLFLEKDLVTDILFCYMPVVIGDGGIIGTGDLALAFKLAGHKLVTKDVIQTHLVRI